jgi:hypothetical protein
MWGAIAGKPRGDRHISPWPLHREAGEEAEARVGEKERTVAILEKGKYR